MLLRKAILLGFTLAALAVACFSPVRVRHDARFWGHVFDVGHIPLWAWLAAVLHYVLPERGPAASRRKFMAFALAVGIGASVELLQPYFGRSRSLGDVVSDAIGAGLALTGIAAWQRSGNWLWRGGHLLAVAASLGIALWPAYEEWRGIRWRQTHFPSLGNFEDEAELKLWSPQGGSRAQPTLITLTKSRASQGEQSLRVMGGAGDWAGVSYAAGGKDWTAFRALALDVFNPHEPLTLFVRVDDDGEPAKGSGRYERGFELAHGWNHLRVPLAELEAGTKSRRLNLKAVRRVAIFTGDGEPSRLWFLDYVHLERSTAD